MTDEKFFGTWGEIAQAIAENKAVAFVGAGVSATVGLKTWKGLLMAQLQSAKKIFSDSDDVRKITEVLETGDLTLGASLLKRVCGQEFTKELAAAIGHPRSPGAAHLAVARLPFSKVVTTNYDPLLELAYDPCVTDIITYRQHDSMLDTIKNDKFALIKLHGNIANPNEAILTDDDFRSIQRIRPLVQCLRILFLTKHVVFIGHSMRDPDLLSLLYDLNQQFPNSGPHYALLDDDISLDSKTRSKKTKNAAQSFLDYLKYSLNVQAVVQQYAGENRTEEFIKNLTLLHGEVSKRQIAKRPITDENPNQGLEKRLGSLLYNACKITGSFRGDLAFFNDRKYSGWATNQSRLRAEREDSLDNIPVDPSTCSNATRIVELKRINQDTAAPDSGLYVESLVSKLAFENRIGQPPDRVKKFLQEFNFTRTETTHGTSIQHFQSDSPASSPTAVRQGC